MPQPLDPTVTAPNFSTNPLAYYIWHLEQHPEMYQAFRQYADAYRVGAPRRRLSADMICHVMRYQSALKAGDDIFQVNNVLTPLYARLYLLERPDAVIDTRPSQLDALLPEERAQLLAAFAPLKETL